MPVTADLTSSIAVVVKNLGESITKLEKELADNLKLASIIMLQIRAIFLRERAKFEVPPEPLPGQLNLAAPVIIQRPITVATTSPGSGA